MKKFGEIALRTLGVLAAVILMMYLIPLSETVDHTAVDGSADWMAQLDDELPLSEVTLPGTHDSATKYVQLAFFSKCQAKTIGEQLEAGYRYLDVRLGLVSDEDGSRLKLMHGFTSCKTGALPWTEPLYLDEVLRQCCEFLDAHPTETVVFAIKQEHGDESVHEFETLLASYVGAEPERWLLTDTLPTVGEARGRLVLMRRYEDAAGLGVQSGIPFIWEDQDNRRDTGLNTVMVDNGTYRLWVQDRFKYDAGNKWTAFTAGMAAGETTTDALSLNFLSTTGKAAYGHPYRFAKDLNARLLSREELRGWIIVDFASATLAEHIYSANFA